MQLGLTCMRTALLMGKHPLWGLQGMKGWLPWRAVKPIHLDNPPKKWIVHGQALAWPLRGMLRCFQALRTIDKPMSKPPLTQLMGSHMALRAGVYPHKIDWARCCAQR